MFLLFPKQCLHYGVLTRVLIPVSRPYPPAGSVPHRFCCYLQHLVKQNASRAGVVVGTHVFIKRYGFEHSNAPIPPVAQIRPGTSNGRQMDPK